MKLSENKARRAEIDRELAKIKPDLRLDPSAADDWNKLVREYNGLVLAERRTRKRLRDAAEVKRQHEAVRAAMCPDCFQIHAAECP